MTGALYNIPPPDPLSKCMKDHFVLRDRPHLHRAGEIVDIVALALGGFKGSSSNIHRATRFVVFGDRATPTQERDSVALNLAIALMDCASRTVPPPDKKLTQAH